MGTGARQPCDRHVDCDGSCWLAEAPAGRVRADVAAGLVILLVALAMLVALWG
jgi:hypothetical protein